nr:hypothetical protein GCM10020093_034080 [Planobispora longispora]
MSPSGRPIGLPPVAPGAPGCVPAAPPRSSRRRLPDTSPCDVDGRLGDPVHVDQFDAGPVRQPGRVETLTPEDDHAQRGGRRRDGGRESGEGRRRLVEDRDPFGRHERGERLRVPRGLVRHDHQPSAVSERPHISQTEKSNAGEWHIAHTSSGPNPKRPGPP